MTAPTEMLKFTFVASSILSCLNAVVIWLRFSAGGAAVAEVAALPVVLLSVEPDLVCALMPSFDVPSLDMPSLDCALSLDMPSLDMPSLDCALLVLAPAFSSEVMLFDFW